MKGQRSDKKERCPRGRGAPREACRLSVEGPQRVRSISRGRGLCRRFGQNGKGP